MSDRVRMTSKTIFQNERITVFRADGPSEGENGVAATVGDEFETDLAHAKELDVLGLAIPLDRADLDGVSAPLEPHYQVSVPQLLADQAARADGATGSSVSALPVDDGLNDQNVAELRALAQGEDIDLDEAKRKDDIVAAIRAARTAKKG